MQKGRRLCKALLDQSLKQRPETTQGKHKRNRNVHGKAKQGGQHRQGTLGHHVTEPGAKRKPTEKQKKKKLRAQRGWGHADTEQLPLRCQSPAEPRQPGAVFGFCAWPLPVLSPYLCVLQALLAAPSLSERARGERGGEEKGKALERMSRAGGGACVAPSSGMQLP